MVSGMPSGVRHTRDREETPKMTFHPSYLWSVRTRHQEQDPEKSVYADDVRLEGDSVTLAYLKS